MNVLAYPSPTTSRVIVFVTALLAAGAFVGGWVHNQVLGDEWVRTAVRCEEIGARSQASGVVERFVQQDAVAQHCRAPIERRRALFLFGGALAAGGAGLLVLFFVPAVLQHRRRLRVLPPALKDVISRMEERARLLGMVRMPTVMLGSTRLHDAFSYGTPRHYRIALPPAVAVRWRDEALFDPLIDHELAHIKHRDVELAWLARCIWYALLPLMVLPVVIAVVRRDLSLVGDYLWRAALLAATVQLTSAALLRSREYDADLRACQSSGRPDRVATLVARMKSRDAQSWWRRLVAKHPSPVDRLAVLDRPALVTRVTFLDGATTGFLAGLTMPVVVSTVATLLIGSGHVDVTVIAASCVVGPLVAGSVGLGLCREALAARVEGRPRSPMTIVWPSIGVGVGLVIGQAASLAQTGLGTVSLHPLAWLPLLGLVGFAATVLVASVAELSGDAAPAMPSARASWLLALVVMSLVFIATLWIGTSSQSPLMLGWHSVEDWLATALQSWLLLGALAGVAGTVVWCALAARRSQSGPAWILEGRESVRWPDVSHHKLAFPIGAGLSAGTVAAAALVVYRLAAGPAASSMIVQRYHLFVWVAALSALAAALPVAIARGPRGAATAALAGSVACITAIAGWLAMIVALGGSLTWSFVSTAAKDPLALSFVAVLLAAPSMLAGSRRGIGAVRGCVASAVIALTCSGVLIAERASLRPAHALPASLVNPPAGLTQNVDAIAARVYLTGFAQSAITRWAMVRHIVDAISADNTADGATRAARIDRDVLPPLRILLADAAAYPANSVKVRAANSDCVTALRTAIAALQTYAVALRAHDLLAFARARDAYAQAQAYWARWESQLTALIAATR